RVDFYSGQERFIYHGNDGTNMPWNDTAQLNFTLPEVREGVIQTILHVARQFPIIRFDAAMTLAKKHIQRLWFPTPGSGGAIPSRAGHGMTQGEFDRAIPVEFWREVVDRVAAEVPDTLLLAEAFWMMAGYFVRTLGMHRMYNSAFMHMLRDEENVKYRELIKTTLEFNPQILKRYVNFMNNPDEETAVEQFGKGDKYFGVATMMATLPGLPMVGHGQIEGFAEKYGMEFRAAKWSETPDPDLVERHQRQIFPLFHRRRLFAEVENFLLYDFYTGSGHVNEDVFAYSNRTGDQRALVVYHNRFGDTRGWIKASSAYLEKNGGDGEGQLVQRSLGEGLDIPNDPNAYVIFRNLVTGQEFIRNCAEVHVKGLFIELFAYQAYVFLDFRLVYDAADGRYGRVNAYLGGKGVPSVDEALQEMFLQVIHRPYRELVNSGMLKYLIDSLQLEAEEPLNEVVLEQTLQKAGTLLRAVRNFVSGRGDVEPLAVEMQARTRSILTLARFGEKFPWARSKKYQAAVGWLNSRLTEDVFTWAALLITSQTGLLGWVVEDSDDPALTSRDWVDEWLLRNVIRQELEGLNLSPTAAGYGVNLVRLLVGEQGWYTISGSTAIQRNKVLSRWFTDPVVRSFLDVNSYDGVEWFNQEAMENWLWWLLAQAAVEIAADGQIADEDKPKALVAACDILLSVQKAVEKSGYRVDKLLGKSKKRKGQ
ncbi:MAG TPA: alpha-amylase, partial [Anaerolineales bacterium]|nr:alpha-amylase [Anaerolineales bacterium]